MILGNYIFDLLEGDYILNSVQDCNFMGSKRVPWEIEGHHSLQLLNGLRGIPSQDFSATSKTPSLIRTPLNNGAGIPVRFGPRPLS